MGSIFAGWWLPAVLVLLLSAQGLLLLAAAGLLLENRRQKRRLSGLGRARDAVELEAAASARELAESKERYRCLVEGSPDGIVLISEGRIAYANDSFLKMMGARSLEQFAEGGLFERVHPDDQGLARERIGMLAAGGRPDPRELRYVRFDGGVVHVETNCQPVLVDGRAGVQIFMRELTARRRAEEALRRAREELQQAQKLEAVGQLAGGIAHDFNNLLTALLGYSNLLMRSCGADDPRRRDAEEIDKTARRAAALTQHLLAFGRRQVLEPRVLDLAEVLSGMEELLRRLIGEDVEIGVSCEPGCGRVKVDRSQLEQVIMALTANARDSMPKGGRIRIEAVNADLDEAAAREIGGLAAGPHVVLRFSDTGPGMDGEVLKRVFEPYFTTRELGRGTGLGLSIVHGIIEQSGGRIVAKSEPGRGSSFIIYLPRTQAPAQEPRERKAAPLQAGKETILLVEDEDAVRRLASRVLQGAGYRVLEAAGGHEALKRAGEHEGRIDLCLTDVVMPSLSGRDVAELVTGARPEIKVLFMSGYTGDAIGRCGVLDSGTNFLRKPFTPVALTDKVREVLGASAA